MFAGIPDDTERRLEVPGAVLSAVLSKVCVCVCVCVNTQTDPCYLTFVLTQYVARRLLVYAYKSPRR